MNIRRTSALGALLVSALLIFGQACDRNAKKTPNADPQEPVEQTTASEAPGAAHGSEKQDPPTREVKDVGPPAPAIFMLGGLAGYTEPCGCTLDVMAGGISRIVGYIEKARGFHPDSIVVDSGGVFFEGDLSPNAEKQAMLKARAIGATYKDLGVFATIPGPEDFAMGTKTYRELTEAAGVQPRAINLKIEGKALDGWAVEDLDGTKTGLIFGVDEALYEGIDGVSATPIAVKLGGAIDAVAKEGAEAIVLIYHGALSDAKDLAKAHPRLDFVQIGHEPRETDQVDEVARTRTLEAFDQGRYVGILKLYNPEAAPEDAPFENARVGSSAELEKLERQIAHINESINKLPPAAPGEEPPLLKNLRKRLADTKARKLAIEESAVEVPEGKRAFLWRTVRMDEGYPLDAEVEQIRVGLNKDIDKLNRSTEFEVPAVEDGEAFYVGNAQCKTCHAEAYAFWEKTNHGHALATLQEQNKEFNQDCIGCHVVGYEKPGGAVIGKLQYDATLNDGTYSFTKDLRNVGCENCHGPGSKHVEAAMFGKGGDPKQHIINAEIDETTCSGSCHVPEHSPRFDYEVYRPQILGPGHGATE